MRRLLLLLGAALALAGCQSALFSDGRGASEKLAAQAGFARQNLRAGSFELLSYTRLRPGANELTVYIESDGRAWIDRTTRSTDPTPIEPVVLRMAASDPAASVAYLARPCQFLEPEPLRRCADRYWTSGRFAEEVVASADAAISALKTQARAQTIRLVGYSGGGTLAMLIAARRADVGDIVTVVAPLDHAAWTRALEVSPLATSLNPTAYLPALSRIRQRHFVGSRDTVVPQALAQNFVRRLASGADARVLPIDGFSHTCCWDENWPRFLTLAKSP
jgi:pimeloyl-ACP methyl ester carboxylesterase